MTYLLSQEFTIRSPSKVTFRKTPFFSPIPINRRLPLAVALSMMAAFSTVLGIL